MKTFTGQLFILVIIYIRNSSCDIKTAYNAGKKIWELHSMIENMTLDSSPDVWEADELLTYILRKQEIKDRIYEIHEQLNQIEKSMNSKLIHHSIRESPEQIILFKCMDTFDLFIENIDGYYAVLYQLMNRTVEFELDSKLQDLMETIDQDVESEIQMIRTIMSNENSCLLDHKNLAFGIANYTTKHSAQLCNSPRMIPNMLVQLFTIVIIAEIKVNIMVTFANLYQYAANNAWKILNSHKRNRFKEHFENYINIFEPNIALADSSYLRACDPKAGAWIRSKSFYEMERTFQTTIFSYRWAKCKYPSCNDLVSERVDQCEVKFQDDRFSCSGIIADCFYLSSVQACALRNGPYRFQYVNSTKLGSLGRVSKCPGDNGFVIEHGVGWDLNHAACACNCYENRNQVSLLIMKSDAKFNWVITGLRFVRDRRILYIQPKEGWVNADGHIDKTSERWVRIPRSIKASDNHPIDRENRVFFLDDLRLLKGDVLTGVKFNKVTRGNIAGFAIQIFGAPFDFESGKLKIENIYHIPMDSCNKPPGTALPFTAISSIHTTSLHTVSPGEMKYVSLEQSDLQDDFGQATLPFFDAVKVEADSPSLLGGVGIFHKGVEGYAGFISLRVYGKSHVDEFRNFKLLHMANGKELFDQ